MKKLSILAIAFILASFIPVAKSVNLKYTFNIGDQYEVTQSTKQKIIQVIMGNNQEIESSIESVTKLKVIELTATGAKVGIEYSKLSSIMKTPMGEMVMDSESATPNNESKAIKSMMGKKFFFYISNSGSIEKIEGSETLWSGLSSLGLDESAAAMTKQIMETTFGEDALKGSLEIAFVFYPENKVKQGDTWKHATTMSMSFPLNVDNTWQLTTLTSASSTLSSQGIIVTADKEKITDLPNGMKAKFDLSGTQSANVNASVKTGWPTDLKTSNITKGKMTLLAGGPIPSDMEVPMEIQTESVYKFEKK